MAEKERIIMVQKGKIEDMDRSFDIEYWQKLGSSAKFEAAWELVLHYHINVLGQSVDDLKMKKNIVRYGRLDSHHGE